MFNEGILGSEKVEDEIEFFDPSIIIDQTEFKPNINLDKSNYFNHNKSRTTKNNLMDAFTGFDFLDEEDIVYVPQTKEKSPKNSIKLQNELPFDLEDLIESPVKKIEKIPKSPKIERSIHFKPTNVNDLHDDYDLNFESILDFDQKNLKTNLQENSTKHVLPIDLEDMLESPKKKFSGFSENQFKEFYFEEQNFESPRNEFPISFEQMLDETPIRKIERPVHFKTTNLLDQQESFVEELDLSLSIDQYQVGFSITSQQQQESYILGQLLQNKKQFDEEDYSYKIEQQFLNNNKTTHSKKKKKKKTGNCSNCSIEYKYSNDTTEGLCGRCFSLIKEKEESGEEQEQIDSDSSGDCLSEKIVDETESQIFIPRKLHKYLIGVRGSSISKINKHTGCEIDFYDDGSIQILGEGKNRKAAIKMLIDRLDEVGWIKNENGEWIESRKFDELWKSFRKKAKEIYELRNYCREQSQHAYHEGDHEAAEKFSEEAKLHQLQFKEESQIAATNIFNEV